MHTFWKCSFFCCSVFPPFLLNLMGWHWLTKFYRFQVYNTSLHLLCSPLQIKSITICPPHTLLHLPHPQGNHHTVFLVQEFFSYFFNPSTYPNLTAVSLLSIYGSVPIKLYCIEMWISYDFLHVMKYYSSFINHLKM